MWESWMSDWVQRDNSYKDDIYETDENIVEIGKEDYEIT